MMKKEIFYSALLFVCALSLLLGAPGNDVSAPARPATNPAKGTMLTLTDYGAEDYAYLVLPQNPPIGGVVIIHDHWGLDKITKDRADQWAAKGYIALAVDLYNGRIPSDVSLANEVAGQVHWPSALKTVKAGIDMLKDNPRLRASRVALIGWNWGGEGVLQIAGDLLRIDAAAAVDPSGEIDLKKIGKLPLCLVLTQDNPFNQSTDEKPKRLEIHTLQAEAGFADPNSPIYKPELVMDAENFLDQFLEKNLVPTGRASQSLIQKAKSLF